ADEAPLRRALAVPAPERAAAQRPAATRQAAPVDGRLLPDGAPAVARALPAVAAAEDGAGLRGARAATAPAGARLEATTVQGGARASIERPEGVIATRTARRSPWTMRKRVSRPRAARRSMMPVTVARESAISRAIAEGCISSALASSRRQMSCGPVTPHCSVS